MLIIKRSPVGEMTPPDDFLTIAPEPFVMERKLGTTDAPFKLDVFLYKFSPNGLNGRISEVRTYAQRCLLRRS